MRDLFGYKNQSVIYNSFRPRYPDKLVDFVINSVASSSPETTIALDVACGTGLFTRRLAPSFHTVVGIDQSESQLNSAVECSQTFTNVNYFKHDAYDLKGLLTWAGLTKEEVSLITIAQGFHWLDYEKFLTSITTSFGKETVFAIVGYTKPRIVFQDYIAQEDILCSLVNKEALKEKSHYDNAKLKLFDAALADVFKVLLPYFQFDRSILENLFQDLPFDKYFSHRELEKFSQIQQFSLFDVQQYLFSLSAYNLYVEKNAALIESGEFNDPLVQFLKTVLAQEGLLASTNSPSFTSSEDSQLLKTISLDVIWNFFVHILQN